MMTSSNGNFSALLTFCAGNSPVTGEFPARGALVFSLIYVWTNGWVNNRCTGDLRRLRVHYDVAVMDITSRAPYLVMDLDVKLTNKPMNIIWNSVFYFLRFYHIWTYQIDISYYLSNGTPSIHPTALECRTTLDSRVRGTVRSAIVRSRVQPHIIKRMPIIGTNFKWCFPNAPYQYTQYNQKNMPCSAFFRFPFTRTGGRLNKKDGLTRYGNSHVKDKTS